MKEIIVSILKEIFKEAKPELLSQIDEELIANCYQFIWMVYSELHEALTVTRIARIFDYVLQLLRCYEPNDEDDPLYLFLAAFTLAIKYDCDMLDFNTQDLCEGSPFELSKLKSNEIKLLSKIEFAMPMPEVAEARILHPVGEFIEAVRAMLQDEETRHCSICKWAQGLFGTEANIRRSFLQGLASINLDASVCDVSAALKNSLSAWRDLPDHTRSRYAGIYSQICAFCNRMDGWVENFQPVTMAVS